MRSRIGITLLALALVMLMCGWADAQAPGPAQAAADSLPSLRISLEARRLWVIAPSGDTTYSAPVAVGSGKVLRSASRAWRFRTPTGVMRVVAKHVAPLWVPPEWHYVELARHGGWAVRALRPNEEVPIPGGRILAARRSEVGIVDSGTFRPIPQDQEIVFGDTLYIPPFGTKNRLVPGVLGPYRLLLSNGIGLHGTNRKESIGQAVTHGCIRLTDEDLTWLYHNVPLRARVVIF